nr:acyl-CoA dehydrogenase [Saccharopolyspora sp. HNM0983]
MTGALHDLLTKAGPADVTTDWAHGDGERWRELWRELAAMGVSGLLVAESDGGLGLGPVELAACLEQFGRAGTPGPLVESLAFAPALLQPADSALPSDLAAGVAVASAAVHEHVPLALDADRSDVVLVCDEQVRAVTPHEPVRYQAADPARRLFRVDAGQAPVVQQHDFARAFDLGVLGCAAYLLGLGTRCLELATEHVRQREQFGKPVGEFQAVKHQLADVLLGLQHARPVVRGAALRPGALDVSAAKIVAGEAAHRAARTALQLHGAIGYTSEHELHLWLLRTEALRRSWGTPDWHRRRVARELTDNPDANIGAA